MPRRRDHSSYSRIDRVFKTILRVMSRSPGVAQGKMFGVEGLKINGKFFVVIVRGRLAVKLPGATVKEIIAKKQGKQFCHIYNPNRIMKEWVLLDATGKNWLEFVQMAKTFVLKQQ
jgi:hypothetical protein